jgi:metal-responsive CopG/Arc/MetJ family transcriptional regulator
MPKPASTKQLVHVTVSKPLLAAVDSLAARKFQSRSEVVRQALLRELEKEGVCPLRPQVAA